MEAVWVAGSKEKNSTRSLAPYQASTMIDIYLLDPETDTLLDHHFLLLILNSIVWVMVQHR